MREELIQPIRVTLKNDQTGESVFDKIAKSASDDIDLNAIYNKCKEIADEVDSELDQKCYHDLNVVRDELGQDFIFGEIDFDSMLVNLYNDYKVVIENIYSVLEYVQECAKAEYNNKQTQNNNEVIAERDQYASSLGGN